MQMPAILFRFFRGQDEVGEREIKDFYTRVRELRADKGVCASVGGFHKKAWNAAPRIDLIGQGGLVAVLNVEKTHEAKL